MKKLELAVLFLGLSLVSGATPSLAASRQTGQSAAPGSPAMQSAAQEKDKTPPSYDMKAQAILDLQALHKKFVSLAEAIPAEKFSWRPGEGVRSIGEVYLHVAAANYNIPTMMGTPKMQEFMAKDFETSITDKTQIINKLSESFEYAVSVVQGMSNADFAKPQKQLGPDANSGDVVYILVTHAHEHLGQSIAYARMNGVVPPWTAAAQAAAAKKAPPSPERD